MKISIVGAGNMGLALIAYLSNKSYDVTLFTNRKVECLSLYDAENEITTPVSSFKVSGDPYTTLYQADIILCTYPAFLRKKFVEQYGRGLKKGCCLGFVPGYGGIEYACKPLIDRGVTIFGLQRVPYVARAQTDGTAYIAGILSKKTQLYTAAIPYSNTSAIADTLEQLLDIPCTALKEYLAITLAPSNPLLHITGLYGAFHGLKQGQAYTGSTGFYTEWNDETSKILFQYDAELQEICRKMTGFDLSEVVPLPIYYESETPAKMTQKLKRIKAFEAVKVPLKQTEDGLIPDLSSRMFVEDFPFGVCVIKDFANMTHTDTPIVDMMLDFYHQLSGITYINPDGSYSEEMKATGIPSLFGFSSPQSLSEFYHN